MEPTSKIPKIVFVHGLGGSANTWDKMIHYLKQSNIYPDDSNIYIYDYSKLWDTIQRLEQMPVDILTNDFTNWLSTQQILNYQIDTRPVYFVGYCLGGLIILNYLNHSVKGELNPDGKSVRDNEGLGMIHQVLLFGTPFKEFKKTSDLNALIGDNHRNRLFKKKVKVNHATLASINKSIEPIFKDTTERLIDSSKIFEDGKYPIPIRYFRAINDIYVKRKPPELIEPGKFESQTLLNGDHFSIIQPSGSGDPKLKAFLDTLITPVGHRNVFIVKEFSYLIEIEPFLKRREGIRYGSRFKMISSYNKGRIKRTVNFSDNNACFRNFQLRYATTAEGGALKYNISPDEKGINKAFFDAQRQYNIMAKEYKFEFTPQYNKDFVLDVEVYRGFDGVKNRCAHFHLGEGMRFYKQKKVVVDLSAYLRHGYNITKYPELYLLPEDLHVCNETSKDRIPKWIVKPNRGDSDKGIWEWVLHDIRSGVLDIIWDIDIPEEASEHHRFGEDAIVIEDIEHMQFNLWEESKRQRFVETLSRMLNKERLQRIFEKLPSEYSSRIPRSPIIHTEVDNLIRTLGEFENGHIELAKALIEVDILLDYERELSEFITFIMKD